MDYFLRFKIVYYNFFESEKNIKLLVVNHYLRIFLSLRRKKYHIFSLIGPCNSNLHVTKKEILQLSYNNLTDISNLSKLLGII